MTDLALTKSRELNKDEKLAESQKLSRAYRAWHRKQLEEALIGVHGDVLVQLMIQLKNLREARGLLNFIEAQDWASIDAETRFIALHEINSAITRLRERAGMAPIDDPLPGERNSLFRRIKHALFCPSEVATAERVRSRRPATVSSRGLDDHG
jgi:hypothetical protein